MSDRTPTLTDEQRADLWRWYDIDQDFNTLAPLIARMVADAEQRALRDAAGAWTQGQWSDVMLPKPTPPAVPVIAYANRMGDWLRARADRIGATE